VVGGGGCPNVNETLGMSRDGWFRLYGRAEGGRRGQYGHGTCSSRVGPSSSLVVVVAAHNSTRRLRRLVFGDSYTTGGGRVGEGVRTAMRSVGGVYGPSSSSMVVAAVRKWTRRLGRLVSGDSCSMAKVGVGEGVG
jgi:hypothetical protein